MAVVDQTGGIITGGLGRDACEQLITRGPGLGAFGLYCEVVPPPVGGDGGGGGPYPYPAHNVIPDGGIQDFYKEVDMDMTPVQDSRAYDLAQKYRVTIRLKIQEREHSREFVVGRHRKNFMVSVINLINNTVSNITVKATKFSAATKRLTLKVKKMISRNY